MHFGFKVAEQSLLPLSQDSPNREPSVRIVSPSPLAYIPDPHTGPWLRDWLPHEHVAAGKGLCFWVGRASLTAWHRHRYSNVTGT